jgi:hypothetical protein
MPKVIHQLHLTNAEILTVKDVLLDGMGLINKEIQVGGSVESSDGLGTYLILVDGDVKLLVDVSQIRDVWQLKQSLKGRPLKVLGTVKSGDGGKLYLNAKLIQAG